MTTLHSETISRDIMTELAKLDSDRPTAQGIKTFIDKSSSSKEFSQYTSTANGNFTHLSCSNL